MSNGLRCLWTVSPTANHLDLLHQLVSVTVARNNQAGWFGKKMN